MNQGIATKSLTGEVRISYQHLINPNKDNLYMATILISKTDVATYNDLISSRDAAYEQGVKNKWNGSRPQMRYPLIYDGDGVRPSGEPFGPECKGHWVLTASSKQKPQCVHISNIHSELLPTDVYSGMYARVTVNFYPFDVNGNRGVGCGLGNVCKTRDGEPLGGRANAESDFADLEQAQPSQPAAAPRINPITGQPM
mgnify:FL=1